MLSKRDNRIMASLASITSSLACECNTSFYSRMQVVDNAAMRDGDGVNGLDS